MRSDPERIAVLEANDVNMWKQLEKIEDKIDGIDKKQDKNHLSIIEKIECFEKIFEKKFAAKRTEQALKAFIWLICIAVIWAVIRQVLVP